MLPTGASTTAAGGVLEKIVNGKRSFFGIFSSKLSAQQIKTMEYHPQSNGVLERFHRQLKESLMCHKKNWTLILPTVLLELRATPCDRKEISCTEMLYRQALKLGPFPQPPGEVEGQEVAQ